MSGNIMGLNVGFAVTGSFCTIGRIYPVISDLVNDGCEVFPILSFSAAKNDTRFGTASELAENLYNITGREPFGTICDVEPIGPKKMLDVLVIEPCTGNTAAKLACGISDTPVTLAAKSHLRNGRPVVIAISTNDGLGANAANIGSLLGRKNIYFVPFRQDDPREKENSIISDFGLTKETMISALRGKQLQPLLPAMSSN